MCPGQRVSIASSWLSDGPWKMRHLSGWIERCRAQIIINTNCKNRIVLCLPGPGLDRTVAHAPRRWPGACKRRWGSSPRRTPGARSGRRSPSTQFAHLRKRKDLNPWTVARLPLSREWYGRSSSFAEVLLAGQRFRQVADKRSWTTWYETVRQTDQSIVDFLAAGRREAMRSTLELGGATGHTARPYRLRGGSDRSDRLARELVHSGVQRAYYLPHMF